MLSIIALVVFLLLVTLAGVGLMSWALGWDVSVPLPLRMGAGYFSGLALLVVAFRCLSALTVRPDVAGWLAMALLLAMIVFNAGAIRVTLGGVLTSIRSSVCVLIGAVLFLAFNIATWSPQGMALTDPFALFGTLHSVRYVWIANYIATCLQVPVLGQNMGQSMALYVLGQLHAGPPFLYLAMLLAASVTMLGVFVYGFARLSETQRSRALFVAVLMMWGSTALSLTHVLVVDSGNPPALSGYTDSLFGVFAVVMLMLCHVKLVHDGRIRWRLLAFAGLLCANSFFMAPQNVVFLFLLGLPLVWMTVRRRQPPHALVFWGLVAIISTAVALPLGSMLTPGFLRTPLEYAGLMTPAGAGKGVQFFPGISLRYGSFLGWDDGQMVLLKQAQELMRDWRMNVAKLVWVFESLTWTSIRVLFFPILGYAMMMRWARRAAPDGRPLPASSIPQVTTGLHLMVGLYVGLAGFAICFLISLNGFKWELSRFLIPGITLGMLALALTTSRVCSKQARWLWVLLAVVSVGPLASWTASASANARAMASNGPNDVRVLTLLGSGPSVAPDSCKTP